MSNSGLTYTFEGDEIFAIHEGRVVASGTDMPEVEGDAVKYLNSLTSQRDEKVASEKRKKATHIVSPNGLKGEILGRTPTIWGNEITVRFENGTISKFAAHSESELKVEWVNEKAQKTASSGLVERLASQLEEDYSHDHHSLVARHDELIVIAREASNLINEGSASHSTEIRLDQIVAAADYERGQVKEAIDYLEGAEAEIIGPPKPEYQVAEQASMGYENNWLDNITQEMIEETEGQDFDTLLAEGPALFTTELDNGALADAATTQEMAYSHIVSKTAGFTGEEVESYREQFVAQVEVARRSELASRQETIHKEAAAEQETYDNVPDEALFM